MCNLTFAIMSGYAEELRKSVVNNVNHMYTAAFIRIELSSSIYYLIKKLELVKRQGILIDC